MSARSFSWPGFALALAGCVTLLATGTGPVIVLAVLLVWIGSLWLVSAQPPAAEPAPDHAPYLRDTMSEMIEHSETPIVVTERNRVIILNHAARKLLGGHALGQDVRMTLRQPEAVKLLARNSDGSAIIRGLSRRRDIWRVNRKALDGGLAVLELINKTAESDISQAHTDFVANASHELRTPLASIIGYVETLREDIGDLDPKTGEKFLGTIFREAQRLQALVSDLMSLSRIEAEKHEQPDQRIDLTSLAASAARDGAGSERIDRLDFEASDSFHVLGDRQQLEQLVRNLVDNAFKYGGANERVAVRLHPKGESRVRMTVTDRGDGIAPEHLPHLTRRFYRTDPGRSRASGGTGLGLAIVKHIVERHRGRLDITSELGEGTRVTVTLSLAGPEED